MSQQVQQQTTSIRSEPLTEQQKEQTEQQQTEARLCSKDAHEARLQACERVLQYLHAARNEAKRLVQLAAANTEGMYAWRDDDLRKAAAAVEQKISSAEEAADWARHLPQGILKDMSLGNYD